MFSRWGNRVTQNFLEMTLDDLPMADGHVDLFMLGDKPDLARKVQTVQLGKSVHPPNSSIGPKKPHHLTFQKF